MIQTKILCRKAGSKFRISIVQWRHYYYYTELTALCISIHASTSLQMLYVLEFIRVVLRAFPYTIDTSSVALRNRSRALHRMDSGPVVQDTA